MAPSKDTSIPSRYQRNIKARDLIEVTELVPRSKAREYRRLASFLRVESTRRPR